MKKKMLLTSFFVLTFAVRGLMVSYAITENEGEAKKWAVEGVMSDACQCMVFCPCEFMSAPTFGHCDDAAILHIDKGHFGEVVLDGLRVAVVSESPEGERLVDTVGRLKFARIYVPEEASAAQTEALAEIARRVFGAFVTGAVQISENEKVEKVKMEVMIEPHRHKVHIPGILDLDLQTMPGGDGKNPIVIDNNPFEEAGFGEVLVARSTTYKYKNADVGVEWDYGGRSASIRTFKMAGEIED